MTSIGMRDGHVGLRAGMRRGLLVCGALALAVAGLAPAGAQPRAESERAAGVWAGLEAGGGDDPAARLAAVEKWQRAAWSQLDDPRGDGLLGGPAATPAAGPAQEASTCRGLAQLCAAWSHAHNDAPGGTVWFADTAFSPDGGTVYAVGTTLGAVNLGSGDGVVVALEADSGEVRWVQTYDHVGYDSAVSLAVAPSGDRAYVAFMSIDDPAIRHLEMAVVAYDAASGQPVWESRYNGPDGLHDWATGLDVSPDGATVVVAGLSETEYPTGYRWDAMAVAYDAASGDLAWQTRLPGLGEGHSAFEAMAFAPDGAHVYAVGWTTTEDWSLDFRTVAIDAAKGDVVWDVGYDGAAGGADDFALALAVAPGSEAVYVTGFSPGADGVPDFVAVAYGADTGDEAWVTRERAGLFGSVRGIAVDPAGKRVYLTGPSFSGNVGWVTMAVDASEGAPLWSTRHAGSNDYFAYSLRVEASPDGARVHAVGMTSGDPDHHEYVNEGAAVDFGVITYDAATGAELWLAQTTGLPNSMDLPFAMAVDATTGAVALVGVSLSAQAGIHASPPPPLPHIQILVQETSGMVLMFAADGPALLG